MSDVLTIIFVVGWVVSRGKWGRIKHARKMVAVCKGANRRRKGSFVHRLFKRIIESYEKELEAYKDAKVQ